MSQPPPPHTQDYDVPEHSYIRSFMHSYPPHTHTYTQDYDLPKCNFRVRKAKQGAARVVVHRELGCAG